MHIYPNTFSTFFTFIRMRARCVPNAAGTPRVVRVVRSARVQRVDAAANQKLVLHSSEKNFAVIKEPCTIISQLCIPYGSHSAQGGGSRGRGVGSHSAQGSARPPREGSEGSGRPPQRGRALPMLCWITFSRPVSGRTGLRRMFHQLRLSRACDGRTMQSNFQGRV